MGLLGCLGVATYAATKPKRRWWRSPRAKYWHCASRFVGSVHARALFLTGGYLVGVTDRSPEGSRQVEPRPVAEETFDTSEELVSAPGIDLAHIRTPNNTHASLAGQALRNEKHVICEKPSA
jgi:predicted dehydrogenase